MLFSVSPREVMKGSVWFVTLVNKLWNENKQKLQEFDGKILLKVCDWKQEWE